MLSKMQINKLSEDHGFPGAKSEVNTSLRDIFKDYLYMTNSMDDSAFITKLLIQFPKVIHFI